MVTARFHELFRKLTEAFLHYDDTPRVADRVVELAEARALLEDARNAIRVERLVMGAPPWRPITPQQTAKRVSPLLGLEHDR